MLITRLARPTSVTLRAWPLAVVFFCLYGLLSIANHLAFDTTGYDLGIFEQIVRSYAQFKVPVSELRGPGFVMLGDHFHPILVTLAPLYWFFPSPITLLLAQAALLAVSVVPVTRTAMRLVSPKMGLVIGVAYGLSWGLQTTVDFDFHEVVFAVPLMAFAIERLIRQEWTAAVCWAAPLILVKEDLPLTFAALGGYLVLKGQRRLGGWVAVAGVVSFLVILKILIPAMNPDGEYAFTGNLGQDFSVWDLPGRLVSPDQKLFLLAAVFAPTAFLAVFSPVSLLAVPTLLWRMVSENPSHWSTGFHYGAVLMPIVYLALADTLGNRGLVLPARIRHVVVVICAVTSLAGITAMPLKKVADPAVWQPDPRLATGKRLMEAIPDNATVAATNNLAPQLTDRTTVQLFPHSTTRRTTDAEWVMADTFLSGWPASPEDTAKELRQLRDRNYQLVEEADGFVLLHRTP
nr:DUF2079 domain-containing protein [Kibdelosporangium sp. MJ126-NF4]CEL17264.1 hypothetical protein [Kibdelosporangium sp. MJ126-NF4]CTQ91506.1 hypothetical protein [Kibdelosporangium sp. MJ126-NF4]